MKRKISILLATAMAGTMLMSFAGCSRELDEDQATQAEENAIDYVKEKYGFKATVKDVESIKFDDGLFGGVSEHAKVTMSHEGTEFEVHVLYDERSSEGEDNYQWDEFSDEISSRVRKEIDADKMQFKVTIPFLNQDIKDIDDLFDDSYCIVNVFTTGLDFDNYEDMDFDFLGNYSEVYIRNYEGKIPDVGDTNGMINMYEWFALESSVVYDAGEFFATEYEVMECYDGLMLAYAKDTLNITYSDEKVNYKYSDAKDIDELFSSYEVEILKDVDSEPDDGKVRLVFMVPAEYEHNGKKVMFDAWLDGHERSSASGSKLDKSYAFQGEHVASLFVEDGDLFTVVARYY